MLGKQTTSGNLLVLFKQQIIYMRVPSSLYLVGDDRIYIQSEIYFLWKMRSLLAILLLKSQFSRKVL